MIKVKNRRLARLWLLHTLLLASFAVAASNEYLCTITNGPTGRWQSPKYPIDAYVPGLNFQLFARDPNSTITLKSDDQNLDAVAINNNIATLRPILDMLGVFRMRRVGDPLGRNFVFIRLYLGANNRFSGPGIPSPSSEYVPSRISFDCDGNGSCARVHFSQVTWGFVMIMDARLSFADSGNIDSPVLQKRIVMPSAPKNEYRAHEMRFIHTIHNTVINIAGTDNPLVITNGDKIISFSGGPIVSEIQCVRPATPLTLTLLDNAITFNPTPMGTTTPQVKTLRWQASGSGRADTWTMRFTSANATASGDGVLLGGAKVTILDGANQVVPLDQAVTISGTQGEFRLALDARTAQAGNYTGNINVTLTAN
ncbi:hypothetical protein I6G97_15405 [Edwardsiella hoshinae]|uniref:Uncharacterized protein n=2 Tax=Edwardsiella hoshinae TaxID=93378 RepID=A0A376DAZ3_9GAMM|nr:hypothetical protein [Edwardsiella hoshinae]QPR27776.1 hypothetical protein I6G97_15405 [Edwardsiella hoshinae]STC86028.1 Uncharacterised protein [Edwardsiella hoshinae]